MSDLDPRIDALFEIVAKQKEEIVGLKERIDALESYISDMAESHHLY